MSHSTYPIPRKGGIAFRALQFLYHEGKPTGAEAIARATGMKASSIRSALYEYRCEGLGQYQCPHYLRAHFREGELHAQRMSLVASPTREFKPLRPQGPQARRPGAEDYKTYPSLFNGERIPYAGIKSFAS